MASGGGVQYNKSNLMKGVIHMDFRPNVYRLDQMTNTKLKSLDRSKTLVMAVQSPIEVHGPHLPVGQDLFEASALAERALNETAKLREDWNFVLLPSMPVSIDCVPELGSLPFPVKIVRDVAYYSLRPFARAGFARLAYSSFHGSPRHICALEDAAATLTDRYGAPALSLFSAAIARMTEGNVLYDAVKDMPGMPLDSDQVMIDTHAGFFETSLGLLLWPELVEDGWQQLPPSGPPSESEPPKSFLFGKEENDLLEKIQTTFERVKNIAGAFKHFRNSTYRGYPALSSKEMGEHILDALIKLSVEILEEFIERGSAMDGHSPLWRMRDVLLNPMVNYLVDDVFKIYSK